MLACLPACLLAYLLACLPACLLACALFLRACAFVPAVACGLVGLYARLRACFFVCARFRWPCVRSCAFVYLVSLGRCRCAFIAPSKQSLRYLAVGIDDLLGTSCAGHQIRLLPSRVLSQSQPYSHVGCESGRGSCDLRGLCRGLRFRVGDRSDAMGRCWNARLKSLQTLH